MSIRASVLTNHQYHIEAALVRVLVRAQQSEASSLRAVGLRHGPCAVAGTRKVSKRGVAVGLGEVVARKDLIINTFMSAK